MVIIQPQLLSWVVGVAFPLIHRRKGVEKIFKEDQPQRRLLFLEDNSLASADMSDWELKNTSATLGFECSVYGLLRPRLSRVVRQEMIPGGRGGITLTPALGRQKQDRSL